MHCFRDSTLLDRPEKVTFRRAYTTNTRNILHHCFSSGKVQQGQKSHLVGCIGPKKDSAVANAPSRSNSRGWCNCCLFSSNRGIKILRQICKGRSCPTYVYGTWTNAAHEHSLGCIFIKSSLKLPTRANRGTRTRG